MLLQRVDNRAYVCDKIDWMYKQANIAFPTNRLGLAKAMGLVSALCNSIASLLCLTTSKLCYVYYFQVAASHLDTVLEKLKDILNNVGQSIFQRWYARIIR